MKEIDSSVLISYLAQKSESENVTISIKEIRKIGHVIEERYPSMIVDMDKYSIESFRVKSKGRVKVLANDKFKETVKQLIYDEFSIEDVVVKKIKYKPRVKLSSLYILIHGQLRRFTEIYADDKDINQGETAFYYVYVKKPNCNHENIEKLRIALVKKLTPVIHSLYMKVNEL